LINLRLIPDNPINHYSVLDHTNNEIAPSPQGQKHNDMETVCACAARVCLTP